MTYRKTQFKEDRATMRFRVERTEWAEIEVDVAGMKAEWGDDLPDDADADDVRECLWRIGTQDLMWSGDFIKVLDKDTDEAIGL